MRMQKNEGVDRCNARKCHDRDKCHKLYEFAAMCDEKKRIEQIIKHSRKQTILATDWVDAYGFASSVRENPAFENHPRRTILEECEGNSCTDRL